MFYAALEDQLQLLELLRGVIRRAKARGGWLVFARVVIARLPPGALDNALRGEGDEAQVMVALPGLAGLNVMGLATPHAVLSALIFNAVIIPLLIPLALRGVRFLPTSAEATFYRNLMVYGVGGLIAPFIGIKLIDMSLSLVL